MASSSRDLTTGSVRKQLLLFAAPFLLTNLLQTLYNMSDTLIISYFIGKDAVDAAYSGGQVLNVAINIITGLSVGGTVVIGQLSGAKDNEKVKRTIGTFLSTMFIAGFVITLFFAVFARQFLVLINTPTALLDDATDFLRIYSYGILFLFGYNAIAAIFRGIGNSKVPMMIVLISSVLNTVLDLILIGPGTLILSRFGFQGWGLRGAAWTSTFAAFMSFALAAIYLIRQKNLFRLTRNAFHVDGALLFRVLKVGIPSAIQSSIFSISLLLIVSRINIYDAGATVGLGSKLDGLVLLPLNALSAATSAMIAQNLGARKIDRVRQTFSNSLLFGYLFAFLAFSVAHLLPKLLFRIVTPDADVIAQGVVYLRWTSFNYIFVTGLIMCNAVAIGSGNTVYPLCTTIMNAFVFRVPIALFFEQFLGYGLAGVFMGLGFANVGGTIAGFIYYRLGFWAKEKNHPAPKAQTT